MYTAIEDSALRRAVKKAIKGLPPVESIYNPFSLFANLELLFEQAKKEKMIDSDEKLVPKISHYTVEKTKEDGSTKIRHIAAPSESAKILQRLFQQFVQEACKVEELEGQKVVTFIRTLRSSTAFVPGSTVIENVKRHQAGQYFYIVDLKDAYDEVDLDLLATIIVLILKRDQYWSEFQQFLRSVSKFGQPDFKAIEHVMYLDPVTPWVHTFLKLYCSGKPGGLGTGCVASPYLFNLYCEVMLDGGVRYLCKSGQTEATYTRYADDLVISSSKPLFSKFRREVRKRIRSASFGPSHRKSKVLYREQGTVFITKTGITRGGKLAFPQKKRRQLHGMIHNYLEVGTVLPNVVAGHIAHFKEYLKGVSVSPCGKRMPLTQSDQKTLALCEQFRKTRRKIEGRMP